MDTFFYLVTLKWNFGIFFEHCNEQSIYFFT